MLKVAMGDRPKDFLHHIASSRGQHMLLNEILHQRRTVGTNINRTEKK
jgi:hypothetical protein